ncbi:MAG: MarR family transcriptional regulator [candidate division Zixibacteria bacterium]|nr:MarR family transcriptional regulator [candidate division Zixibacteria bacterium]
MNKKSNGLSDSPVQIPSVPKARYDLQVLRSLRRIIRAVDIYSRKLKTTHQLTAPQLICLLCVVEEGPLNSAAISKSIFLSPSTIVGILDRLESRDLVSRERDSNDRRIVNVTASDQGIKLAKLAPSPLQDNLANALLQLPMLEQATIALSLQRVVDLMEAEQLDAAPILETGQLDVIGEKDADSETPEGQEPNHKRTKE